MRKLVIRVHASETVIDLDDYYDANETINRDDLYDYHVHEVVSQPSYEYVVVDENGKNVNLT